MKDKFKNFINDSKTKIGLATLGVITTVPCSTVFASDSDPLKEAFTTGVTSSKTDFLAYAAIAIGVGIGIFAATFAVKKGMSFFKTIANKG